MKKETEILLLVSAIIGLMSWACGASIGIAILLSGMTLMVGRVLILLD